MAEMVESFITKATAITDDATLAPGTYTLTVDLIHATYTIE